MHTHIHKCYFTRHHSHTDRHGRCPWVPRLQKLLFFSWMCLLFITFLFLNFIRVILLIETLKSCDISYRREWQGKGFAVCLLYWQSKSRCPSSVEIVSYGRCSKTNSYPALHNHLRLTPVQWGAGVGKFDLDETVSTHNILTKIMSFAAEIVWAVVL